MQGPHPAPDELFAAWLEAEERGVGSPFEELVAGNPEHAPALRAMHSDWQHFAPILERVVPGSIADVERAAQVEPSAFEDNSHAMSPELIQRLGIQLPEAGRYRFRSILGRGGGGVVLRVWDTKLQRPLAMKVVLGRGETRPTGDTPPVDATVLTRFVDEARIASQLDHPGIVPVHELGTDASGRAFFTMRLVRGEDLGKVFERARRCEPEWTQARLVGILTRVCEALAYAHGKGVIHRDLKPANVMVGRHGEVHVMDWGLARAASLRTDVHHSAVHTVRAEERERTPDSPLLTGFGAAVGTPAYMSPEQARGEPDRVDARSDVYAIGAMLYEILAGEPPYVPRGAILEPGIVLMRVVEGPPRPLRETARGASGELVAICERAMAHERERRYATVGALEKDLRAYLERRVVDAYEAGPLAALKKWCLRNNALAVALLSVVLLMVGGSSFIAFMQTRAKREANDRARESRWQSYLLSIRGAEFAQLRSSTDDMQRLLENAPEEYRDWEWGFLEGSRDRSILVLRGPSHPGGLYACAIDPSGERLMTASHDEARLWDAATGAEVAALRGHSGSISCCSFSPSGTRVVTGGSDKTARVWDTAGGAELMVLSGHKGSVLATAFSPDGRRLVTVGNVTQVEEGTLYLRGGEAVLWDASTGERLRSLECSEALNSCALSSDGKRALLSGYGGALVWNLDSGEFTVGKGDFGGLIRGCGFEGTSPRVLVVSDDTTASLQDLDGRRFAVLHDHAGKITDAALSPQGDRILTASHDGTARLWSASTGEELALLRGHAGEVTSCAFAPRGGLVLTTSKDRTARLWSTSTASGIAAFECPGSVSSGSLSPDGKRLAVGCFSDRVPILDTTTGRTVAELTGHGSEVIFDCVFASDGSSVLTASGDATARIWNAFTGAELRVLRGHTMAIRACSYSPDGRRVLTASEDRTARLWDAASGTEIAALGGHTAEVMSCAFSPDGKRCLTASIDGTGRLWDATTGKGVAILGGHSAPVRACAFSPTGSQALTASDDGTARLWDALSGSLIRVLRGHASRVRACAFSRDGKLLVTGSGDSTAMLWDVATGEVKAVLRGHSGEIRACAFSPDGKRVLTGATDETARLWDSASGDQTCVLSGGDSEVRACDFSADGLRVFVAFEGGVRIWSAIPWESVEHRLADVEYPEVRARIRTLADELGDWVAVAAALRATEPPSVRKAALDTLPSEAREDLDAAWIWVDGLRKAALNQSQTDPSAVMQEIESDTAHSLRVRSHALRLARLGEAFNPYALNEDAWAVVDPDSLGQGDFALALRQAETAVRLEPGEANYRDTLAWALLRNGRMEEAMRESATALELAREDQKAEFGRHLERLSLSVRSHGAASPVKREGARK